MDGSEELTARQLKAIPHVLAAASIEEGCKRARVSKAAFYLWLAQDGFKEELRRQREELTRTALDTLKAGIAKATETLVKLLDSDKEAIQARAAEDIIEFTQKAIEYEELEKRIDALEDRIKQQGGKYR